MFFMKQKMVFSYIKVEQIAEVIERAEKQATEKEKKYPQLKKIRRYFFIGGDKLEMNNPELGRVLEILTKYQTPEDKIYALN